MAVKVGSARSSYGNTAAGDQNNGLEVSTQDYYVHSKGWRVFRAKDPTKRYKIADGMKKGCANNDIGYSQGTRLTLTENVKPYGYDPSKTTKKVNTDCSALVRCCCLYAGIKVGDFITSNEPSKLLGTGEFIELTGDKYTKKSDYLCAGDILCTKTKGHTVVVLTFGPKCEAEAKIISYNLGDRELDNGCEGDDVKQLQNYLIQLGFSCGEWGADGEFGDCTEQAVKAFQSKHGLIVDGVAGKETISKLESLLQDTPDAGTSVLIVGGKCYVRKGPGKQHDIIGTAAENATYIYDRETSNDGWLKIVYKGTPGWVSGKYGKLI